MSQFSLQEIHDAEAWNTLLSSLKPNTFLQSWEWGQLQQTVGEGVRYLSIQHDNQSVGALLLLTVNAKRGRFLFCPHGPLMRDEASTRQALRSLLPELKKMATTDHACAIRISPLLVVSPENETLFRELGFRPAPLHMHTELTWMLDITKSEEELLRDMRKTTRQAIRKATAAGIKTEIHTTADALSRFWPLYSATRQRHQFVPFAETFLRQQFELFARNNQVYIVLATHEGKDVAGAIFIQHGSTVFYHHGASVKLPAAVPASQVVQWASIQEAQRRGATHYNFWGIAPKDKLKHPFAGITTFKTGFGGYAIDYMHAQDLPLTLGYWKLWAVEMWRKFRRGF
jgi:peptidoglycan pentaglycine glycine transferase (the first glycine)